MLTDKEFLAKYDFDKEVPYEGRNPDWVREEWELVHQTLDTFLRGLYQKSFSLDEMVKFTGIGRKAGLNYLRSRSDVIPTLEGKDGRVERWKSYAKPFPATEEGFIEETKAELARMDALGEEARKDFEWTKTRGRKKRNRAVIFR